jgi:hypothetical protein
MASTRHTTIVPSYRFYRFHRFFKQLPPGTKNMQTQRGERAVDKVQTQGMETTRPLVDGGNGPLCSSFLHCPQCFYSWPPKRSALFSPPFEDCLDIPAALLLRWPESTPSIPPTSSLPSRSLADPFTSPFSLFPSTQRFPLLNRPFPPHPAIPTSKKTVPPPPPAIPTPQTAAGC